MAALTPTGKERRLEGYNKAVGGHWDWVDSRYVQSNGQGVLVEGHYERVGCQDVWVSKEIECRGVAADEDGNIREYFGWYEVQQVNGDTVLSAVPGALTWGEIVPSSDGGNDATPS